MTVHFPSSSLNPAQRSATLTSTGGPAGGLGGSAALAGDTTICVFSCLFIQVVIPLTVNGAGGTFTGTALGQPLTVNGGFWTTGQAVINGVSIADLERTLELARMISDARSERTANIIRERIANR